MYAASAKVNANTGARGVGRIDRKIQRRPMGIGDFCVQEDDGSTSAGVVRAFNPIL